ncbi:hypothetical protein ACHAC9_20680 [Massilia sp. CMS3.1]|uniref:hypothetical protein n=1 Tax=Massilia sp. CMS3.1 TaxID=3373083 RepID=UPI003EE515B6
MDLFSVSEFDPQVDHVPRVLYASLDDVPLVDEEKGNVLFEFSAVDKSEFDAIPSSTTDWQAKWARRMSREGQNRPSQLFPNMRFVNLEISLPLRNISAKRWLQAWRNPGADTTWYQFELDLNSSKYFGSVKVLVYPNLFLAALPFGLRSAKKVTRKTASILNAAFNMVSWPSATSLEIKSALRASDAGVLAVHDIGQGNACGLRESPKTPVNLWIDIGCGVNRNAKTTPPGLVLCYSYEAPILLTHWDKDHWSGARKGAPPSNPDIFLSRTWIVPRQRIKAQHSKLADDIISAGGRILVVDSKSIGASSVLNIPIEDNRQIEIALGRGTNTKDPNNCECLVIRIIDNMPDRKWLLPGDVSYSNMPTSWQVDSYVAIVASHHGADVGPTGLPGPYKSQPGYSVLAFSFGPNNAHGSTSVRHPTHAMSLSYNLRGWGLTAWVTAGASAGGAAGWAAVCTAEHLPLPGTHLLGKLIGWQSAPKTSSLHPPCRSLCTAAVT